MTMLKLEKQLALYFLSHVHACVSHVNRFKDAVGIVAITTNEGLILKSWLPLLFWVHHKTVWGNCTYSYSCSELDLVWVHVYD